MEVRSRDTLLTDHPVRRLIIDLIMKIILDSFALPPTKNTQVVEIILNVSLIFILSP